MGIISRKYVISIGCFVPPKSIEVYEELSKTIDIKYVGVYVINHHMCIYVQSVNRINKLRLLKRLETFDFDIDGVKIFVKFEGITLNEYGHKPIESKFKKKIPVIEVPDILPVPPGNNLIIGDTIYEIKRSIQLVSSGLEFHAILGFIGGSWNIMSWMGPSCNIKPISRKRATPEKTEQILKLCQNTCPCGIYISRESMNVDIDHIIPLKLGGTNDVSNLQAICTSCHRRKSGLECRNIRKKIIESMDNLESNVLYITKSETFDDRIMGTIQSSEIVSMNPGMHILTFI